MIITTDNPGISENHWASFQKNYTPPNWKPNKIENIFYKILTKNQNIKVI